MKLEEFQKDLKPGDIIYRYNNSNKYYKFIRYEKCYFQGKKELGCGMCKGDYIVENLNSKTEFSVCGTETKEGDSKYIKIVFEEFIKKEEFSV